MRASTFTLCVLLILPFLASFCGADSLQNDSPELACNAIVQHFIDRDIQGAFKYFTGNMATNMVIETLIYASIAVVLDADSTSTNIPPQAIEMVRNLLNKYKLTKDDVETGSLGSRLRAIPDNALLVDQLLSPFLLGFVHVDTRTITQEKTVSRAKIRVESYGRSWGKPFQQKKIWTLIKTKQGWFLDDIGNE